MTNIASQYDLKPVRIFKKDGTATTISIRHADYIRLHAYAVKNGHRSAPAFLRSLVCEVDAPRWQLSSALRQLAQERTGIQFGKYHKRTFGDAQ